MGSKKYTHVASVTGRGEFPMDMLRYDCCFPRSSGDATAIARSFKVHDEWNVRLTTFSVHREWRKAFTEGRWQSFGCSIQKAELY